MIAFSFIKTNKNAYNLLSEFYVKDDFMIY